MTTADLSPVLRPGRVYLAGDRFVCCAMRCAGQTALYTGETYDGIPLRPVRGADVIELASIRPGTPLTCECGAYRVRYSMVDGLIVERAEGRR